MLQKEEIRRDFLTRRKVFIELVEIFFDSLDMLRSIQHRYADED